MSLTGTLLEPVKVAGIVSPTAELLRFTSPAARALFDTELRRALSAATNSEFLAGLIALTTPTGSSGATAANILTDLRALLGGIRVSEASRLYFITHGDDAKGIATVVNTAGVLQFPNFGVASGGEILPGITGLISNDLPSGTALLVDASGLLLGDDDGVTLDIARQTSLVMDTAPDSPETASTVPINLWQLNRVALRAERSLGYAPARSTAVASLSGVNYG